MNRQSFRPLCGRARLGLLRGTPRRAYATNQPWFSDDETADGDRTRASVDEITSLLKNKAPLATAKGAVPRGRTSVIDVKTLPRGPFRRQTGPPRRDGPPHRESRFSGPGSNEGGETGVQTARRRRKRFRGGEDEDEDGKPKQSDAGRMDPEVLEFDDAMRFGLRTRYRPSLTLEALAPFAPATPSTAPGRAATVLQNLGALGMADPVGAPLGLQARNYADDLAATGVRFFADAADADAADEYLQAGRAGKAATDGPQDSPARIVGAAGDEVRKAVVDRAVAGRYERPVSAADPVGAARAWHLRAETYMQKDVDNFERKLRSLVDRARAGGGGGAAKAKAKARAA